MDSKLRKLFLLLLVVAVVSNAPAWAEIPGFPEDGLADRIAFWEKVFTIYGEDDLIIHDRERVDLIYAVVKEDQRRTGERQVRSLLSEVRSKISTPDELSPDARRLYDAIEADGVRMRAGDIAVLQGRLHIQRGIKERFRDGVVRSGRYLEYFQSVFESEGVPPIIALLPLVESAFLNEARSYAGAAGIWQFMPSTGRQFMRVTRGRDDRLNPAVATRAAARLLQGNYEALGTWPLAITAYNHGRAGMARAKRSHGTDMANIVRNYDSRTWGYASKNFYAEFIAAVNVYNEYEGHFGPLALDSPMDFSTPTTRIASRRPVSDNGGETHRVRSGETLGAIASRYGTTVNRIMDLNALPGDLIFAGETLLVSMDGVGASPEGQYRVRLGDTLSEIAHDFGMGLQELMRLNGLRDSRIYAGQVLSVR
jgi:membrane-bound lytic murein transglycosylase D